MLTIVTWLWTPVNSARSYEPEHVNALCRAVASNTTIPLRFVCVTDIPHDPRFEVDTYPLWRGLEKPLRPGDGWDVCWRRLPIFGMAPAAPFGDRIISMDLDAVVVGNIDDILLKEGSFVGWNCANRIPLHYNGSLWALDMGAHPEVWTSFDPERTPNQLRAKKFIGTDHSQWSDVLGPNMPQWKPQDGVVSYRYHCQKGLPKHARIVFFHGKEKPWTVEEAWCREHYQGTT